MRTIIYIFVLVRMVVMISSCSEPGKSEAEMERARKLMADGHFKALFSLAASPQLAEGIDPVHRRELDSMVDYAGRYMLDFRHTDEDIIRLLADDGVMAGEAELREWEDRGELEFMWIDGERRYFRWAHRNLYRINDSLRRLKQIDRQRDESLAAFCMAEIGGILAAASPASPGDTVRPQSLKLTYTITVEAGAVPPGETIRCWMPYPREDSPRQDKVKLISAYPEDYIISPVTAEQRTIYFEQKAVEGEPALFRTELEFRSLSQYFDPVLLAGKASPDIPGHLREYTIERPPHISFSDDIKALAGSLVTDRTGPFKKMEAFYRWINDNIIWTSAVEYGLMADIPAYVLKNGRGDCGMQTLLFLSLCRYSGIPARWQSGWMLHRGHVNLHDWAEVWFEPYGWVPVDVSFGLQPSDRPEVRDFYISGMDSYRFIVNSDYGRQLYPPKIHPRSEPLDFQRGELEWDGGNLYFDKWRYSMQVGYLP